MLTEKANAICLLEVLKEYSDAEHILPMRDCIFAMISRMGRICSASEYSFRTSKRQMALAFSVSMVHIPSFAYFT